MDDRTLLERAAKAAGYSVDARASFKTWRDSQRLALLNPQGGHTLWNGLTDDGDALRLAVKLSMNVFQAANSAYALPSDDDGTYEEQVRYIDAGSDPYAATRRAIVRAAAEIGGE